MADSISLVQMDIPVDMEAEFHGVDNIVVKVPGVHSCTRYRPTSGQGVTTGEGHV